MLSTSRDALLARAQFFLLVTRYHSDPQSTVSTSSKRNVWLLRVLKVLDYTGMNMQVEDSTCLRTIYYRVTNAAVFY